MTHAGRNAAFLGGGAISAAQQDSPIPTVAAKMEVGQSVTPLLFTSWPTQQARHR